MSDGRMATVTSQTPSVMAMRKQFPDIGVTLLQTTAEGSNQTQVGLNVIGWLAVMGEDTF